MYDQGAGKPAPAKIEHRSKAPPGKPPVIYLLFYSPGFPLNMKDTSLILLLFSLLTYSAPAVFCFCAQAHNK